jgi:hypothetical protein
MRVSIPVVAIAIACLICGVSLPAHAKSKGPSTRPPEPGRKPATVGQVISVDPFSNLMTLRTGNSTITVDISSPILKGYASVTEIRRGQVVAVRYTANAIHIEKTTGTTASIEKSAPVSPRTTKKEKLPRRAKTDGQNFEDVDNNKDGWISPVELCVLIPDMTMEQFRKYDKNGDGRLDRVEYGQIKPGK